LGAFSRRFNGAKTALSAIMKTRQRFHTASIACASQAHTRLLSQNRIRGFDFTRFAFCKPVYRTQTPVDNVKDTCFINTEMFFMFETGSTVE
jgi:hypothetical protein